MSKVNQLVLSDRGDNSQTVKVPLFKLMKGNKTMRISPLLYGVPSLGKCIKAVYENEECYIPLSKALQEKCKNKDAISADALKDMSILIDKEGKCTASQYQEYTFDEIFG